MRKGTGKSHYRGIKRTGSTKLVFKKASLGIIISINIMSDIQKIIQRFEEKPYLRRMSSKSIAKRLHKDYRDVVKARNNLNKSTNKITTVEK